MPRRTYAQYCAVARSLDVIGERWTLLIVRELALGPRRYTDLHADLPGISTDVLASRLKELEADGVVQRRTFAPSAPVRVYDLTERGKALVPVVSALAVWGAPLLTDHRETDALRHHWYLLPLSELLSSAGADGLVELRVDNSSCYVRLAPGGPTILNEVSAEPDAVLTLSPKTASRLLAGECTVAESAAAGDVSITGSSGLAERLCAAGG